MKDETASPTQNAETELVTRQGSNNSTVTTGEANAVIADADAEMYTLYKGQRLSCNFEVVYRECLVVEKPKGSSRCFAYCSVCSKHVSTAVKFAVNGRVPVAFKPGIRYDKKRIVDHLLSPVHEECLRVDNAQKQWNKGQHPWMQLLKKQKAETVRLLTRLAIDVYNDNRSLTLTAWSWPSRYLSALHSQRITNSILNCNDDSTPAFEPFEPSSSAVHYVSPDAYREMLDVIGSLERSAVKEKLQMCDAFFRSKLTAASTSGKLTISSSVLV